MSANAWGYDTAPQDLVEPRRRYAKGMSTEKQHSFSASVRSSVFVGDLDLFGLSGDRPSRKHETKDSSEDPSKTTESLERRATVDVERSDDFRRFLREYFAKIMESGEQLPFVAIPEDPFNPEWPPSILTTLTSDQRSFFMWYAANLLRLVQEGSIYGPRSLALLKEFFKGKRLSGLFHQLDHPPIRAIEDELREHVHNVRSFFHNRWKVTVDLDDVYFAFYVFIRILSRKDRTDSKPHRNIEGNPEAGSDTTSAIDVETSPQEKIIPLAVRDMLHASCSYESRLSQARWDELLANPVFLLNTIRNYDAWTWLNEHISKADLKRARARKREQTKRPRRRHRSRSASIEAPKRNVLSRDLEGEGKNKGVKLRPCSSSPPSLAVAIQIPHGLLGNISD